MSDNGYQALVADYTLQLKTLIGPSTAAARRGLGPAIVEPEKLSEQADRLADLTARLTQETATYLNAEEATVRLGAEQRLMAQAVASLYVADSLLEAAVTAGESEPPALARGLEAEQPPPLDQLLALLQSPLEEIGSSLDTGPAVARAARATASREELIAAAGETLTQVTGGVIDFSQDALAGLMGLDVALLKQAATLISQELGQLVERLGDQVSGLVAKATTFILRAYDSVLAAIGQDAASAMRQQLALWLDRLQQGESLSTLLALAFDVASIRQQVHDLVQANDIPGPALAETRDAVATLTGIFETQVRLPRQLLAGLGIIKRFPATRLPLVELASAAVYLLLMGYVVFLGGDYVDAPRLERLGRVPGVLHVIEKGLAVS